MNKSLQKVSHMAGTIDYAISANLFDIISFSSDGTVINATDTNLLNVDIGCNIFDACHVFVGIEDSLGEIIDDIGGRIILNSVRLDINDQGPFLDLRICRAADNEFMLIATDTPPTSMPYLNTLIGARAKAYEGELLKLEQERFREYYEANPTLCFAITLDGNPIVWSRKLLSFASNNTTSIEDWINDFIAVFEVHEAYQMLKKNGVINKVLWSAIRADGAICIVEVAAHAVKNSLNGNIEFYFVLQDMTVRESNFKKISTQKQQLEIMSDQLTKSNSRLEGFAHVAAHDLLGPLGRMSAFSDLINVELGSSKNEDVKFALYAISKSAQSCRRVVIDLLELAKLSGIEPEFEPIAFQKLLENIVLDIAEVAEGKQAFDIHFDKIPDAVSADHKLASVVFRNILSNAYKYRSPDRLLIIKCWSEIKSDGEISILISDNGTGFSSQAADTAFNPFTRMNNSRDVEGTGLGLSIVQNACEVMGWVPSILSTPDVGTTVVLNRILVAD